MRLICPNCGAQYEIDADAIPQGGRDVECSDCGETWTAQAGGSGQSRSGAVAQAMPPPMARAPLDPSVADILRTEAAHEASLRQSAPTRITQPAARRARDTVLLADQSAAPPPERPARPRAVDQTVLPDIAEINATLRSGRDRDTLPPLPLEQAVAARRSGWRGFLVTAAVIAALALVYAVADDLSSRFPAAADPLSAYVAFVNDARLWIDAQVQKLITAVAG